MTGQVLTLPPEPPVGATVELLSGKDKGLQLSRIEREPSASEYHWREQYRNTCWRWDEVLRWGARVVESTAVDTAERDEAIERHKALEAEMARLCTYAACPAGHRLSLGLCCCGPNNDGEPEGRPCCPACSDTTGDPDGEAPF